MFIGGLCGLFILGLFVKKSNAIGVIAGMGGSVIIMLYVWQYHLVHSLLYTAVGTVECLVIGYIVSIMINRKIA